MNLRVRPDSRAAGFSLIELLVVAMIVAIMAAAAIPALSTYFKNYEIRQAANAVAGEITVARNKAIAKNVNWGVLFVVVSPTTYRWVIEDDVTRGQSTRISFATALADDNQVGPLRTLPASVEFGTTCTGFAANDSVFRFNRLGMWCDPGSNCDAIATGFPNYIMNSSGVDAARICLVQDTTGLQREVRVTSGGRVRTENIQR